MNVVVVDTSSWISYFAAKSNEAGKGQKALDEALREGRVFLSPVVAAELMSGFLTKTKRERLADFLRDLPLCDASVEHWLRVGALRSRLARKGLTISTPDAHVAQCALDLDGYLLSEDKIFRRLIRPCGLHLL
ncbi:MAG: PIN domain-containing protein [Planctomycetes bacterium]|nr:PIN domain-containing protein [Planctomycetota bacterium]